MKLFKKMKRIYIGLFLFAFIGISSAFLTGCESANSSLEKVHIMNNGCFITCENNKSSFNKNKILNNANANSKRNEFIKGNHLG